MSAHLFKSTAIITVFTLLSRILGFIRDMVIAHIFGAGGAMDAFLVALKIPNFMRRLFAEGAFSQAFIPTLSDYKIQSKQAVQDFIDHVAGRLGGVLVFITLLGILGAPALILLFAPGFWGEAHKFALASDLLRITFSYLLLISLTAFAGAILNSHSRFAVPAFTPVILNLFLIAAAFWLSPWFAEPIKALAWAVFFAGIAQLLFQWPFLLSVGLLPRPRWGKHAGVSQVLKLMLPTLFAVSVTQISLLIDTLMASFLPNGSVSWLYYADRLLEFPIGLFGIALATVILPTLSKNVAEQDFSTYSRHLDWALRWVLLIGLPCSVGLIALAQPIIGTLFYRGEFTLLDVVMSSQSLIAYTIGLVAFVLIKILASGFFSQKDTKTPVKAAVIAMGVNIVLNLAFIIPLRHAGLALATACAAIVNAAILFYFLRKNHLYQSNTAWWPFGLRLLFANGCMLLLLLLFSPESTAWLQQTESQRVLTLLVWLILASGVYIISLFISGLRFKHFIHL